MAEQLFCSVHSLLLSQTKVSARECHQLFKIEVRLNQEGSVEFSYPGDYMHVLLLLHVYIRKHNTDHDHSGVENLVLPLPKSPSADTKVHIFGEDVEGADCGDTAAQWVGFGYLVVFD